MWRRRRATFSDGLSGVRWGPATRQPPVLGWELLRQVRRVLTLQMRLQGGRLETTPFTGRTVLDFRATLDEDLR
jgi:hypothetical protein